MRVILATLGLCLACLGGCGQMGPLYMPADESAAAGEPAAGDPAAGDPAAGDPAADAAAEGDDGAPATLEID
jgi:predicted small lipoprotein YifL